MQGLIKFDLYKAWPVPLHWKESRPTLGLERLLRQYIDGMQSSNRQKSNSTSSTLTMTSGGQRFVFFSIRQFSAPLAKFGRCLNFISMPREMSTKHLLPTIIFLWYVDDFFSGTNVKYSMTMNQDL